MRANRPILFSPPMIRALLDYRKSQTRRAIKQAVHFVNGTPHVRFGVHGERKLICPYGKAGDLLWVRERAHYGPNRVAYSADNSPLFNGERVDGWGPAKPAIHMPRWASRITLKITGVKFERLRDLCATDALAEGLDDSDMLDPIGGFHRLWESINGADGPNSWDANPWVWVISFATHLKNVDNLLMQLESA